jgi:diguanylate cyclase (GGDEF)-like protein/PAS domain S-box-containing protein
LIIDENANTADHSISVIKSAGFAVRETIVSSAQEFEDIANQLEHIHLIIFTNNVDNIDISVIRSLHKDCSYETPIIVLNADNSVDEASLLEQGASAVISSENTDLLKQIATHHAKTALYIKQLEDIKQDYNELDQRYKKILDSSRDAICYVHQGMHTYTNSSYLELFGINDTDEANVLSILELVSPDDQAEIKSILKKINKEHLSGTANFKFKLSDNEYKQLDCEYNPVIVEGETCAQFVIYHDTDGSVELQQQLSYISERDIETGFLHRKSIVYKIEEALNSVDIDKKFSFIQIDIANIVDLSDRYGLGAIDQLNASIASALKTICHQEDLLAKITDESFGILTPLHTADELDKFGKEIRKVLNAQSIKVNDKTITPDCYIGASIIDSDVEDVSDIIAGAKSACDHAWENEIQDLYINTHEHTNTSGTLLDKKWTTELQNAIRDNRLTLLFQPVVSIGGQTGDKYQVFTQLVSAEGAKISVAEVLPSIERSGVSVMLDRWVISNSIKQLAKHGQKSPDSLFFIKLTAGSLNDKGLPEWISQQCQEANIQTSRLVFDIREETIISHLKEMREFAQQLKDIGSQVAIDAFGIGQNPDKILSMIPASYLKLSFQLMAGLKDGDKDKIDTIRQICSDAKSKEAMVIAQFVETAQVLSNIWTMDIDFASGDFFQKPAEMLEYDFSSAA